MNTFEILKTVNKKDFLLIKGPLLLLSGFIIAAVLFFPKPSRIYHDGYLKECTCIGIKASPRTTKGVISDVFCIGIPISCKKTQVIKSVPYGE